MRTEIRALHQRLATTSIYVTHDQVEAMTALGKPWVNQEMDAGLVRKIRDQCKFIPLRYGLRPEALPPLLSGLMSPQIDAAGANLQQLINDIHGINCKPALGPAPAAAQEPKTGYSPAATAVAKIFVMATTNATLADPQRTIDALASESGLPVEDVRDALHELRSLVQVHSDHDVWPEPGLFAAFDQFWMEWNPAQDALRLAADLVNDPEFPREPSKIAERYAWAPRRLNPSITYLGERSVVELLTALMSGPFVAVDIERTDATRRFVRSRS
jgi:hypothetical protein